MTECLNARMHEYLLGVIATLKWLNAWMPECMNIYWVLLPH